MKNLKQVIMLCILMLTVVWACVPSPATAESVEPDEVCGKVLESWDNKNSLYKREYLESATEHRGIYYCIARVMKSNPEYGMPIHVRIVYNIKTDAYTIKRWGY